MKYFTYIMCYFILFCLLFSNFSNCIFAQNPMAFERSAVRFRLFPRKVRPSTRFPDFFYTFSKKSYWCHLGNHLCHKPGILPSAWRCLDTGSTGSLTQINWFLISMMLSAFAGSNDADSILLHCVSKVCLGAEVSADTFRVEIRRRNGAYYC